MSDKINITGIKGYGYHGVFDFEKREGQDFIVDIELVANLKKLNDDLAKTVDYSKLVNLVSSEITTDPVNLIETLAERIAEKILESDKKIKEVTVTVHKPAAPVSAKIDDISVSIHKIR